MAQASSQHSTLMRLRRISGQVQGLSRMVMEGRDAIEIVGQVSAAEAALHSVARIVLRDHLEAVLLRDPQEQSLQERTASVEEVIRLFSAMRPK